VIIAKSAGVIAGQGVAESVFRSLDRSFKYTTIVPDGTRVESGTVISRLTGKTHAILSGERTALNLMGRCSGIASLTREYVEAVQGTNTRICETRKTAPGLRILDKASVRVGGGVNHRYALYDAFLLKENHIAAAGGITVAINACRDSNWGAKLRIMVEARNLAEAEEAANAHPHRILLDNMTPNEIGDCIASIKHIDPAIEVEATGGINLTNLRAYADAGVEFISIGALTHSVKVLDLSLLIE
jgi:nicotinate-nucleotide pyrophosphorylase (carboxylating)